MRTIRETSGLGKEIRDDYIKRNDEEIEGNYSRGMCSSVCDSQPDLGHLSKQNPVLQLQTESGDLTLF